MTSLGNEHHAGARAPNKSPRRRFALIAAALVLAMAAIAYFFRPDRAAKPDATVHGTSDRRSDSEPPSVDLAGCEPAVARAILAARATVEVSPRSAGPWGKYGMVLLAHELKAESQVCFAVAERLDPRDVRWPYYQGISLATGDTAAAVAKLERAVELARDDQQVVLARLAEVLLDSGRWNDAERHLRVLAEREPMPGRVRLGLARVAAERGQWRTCLEHADAVADNPSARKTARLLVVDAQRHLGEPSRATQLAAQAAALPDDRPWPDRLRDDVVTLRVGSQRVIDEANRLLDDGRAGEAKTLLAKAVGDYPTSEPLWQLLGKAHLRERDPSGALKPLGKAIELQPNSVVNRYHLGVALFQLRRYREAAQSLCEAIRLKPDAEAFSLLAACEQREGNLPPATDALREAVRLAPHDAKVQFNLGALLAQQGQFAAAAEHLARAVELNPDDGRAADFLREVRRQLRAKSAEP